MLKDAETNEVFGKMKVSGASGGIAQGRKVKAQES